MFKFADKKQVLWPVTITAPSADGSGVTEEFECKVLYELMTRSEAQQIQNDLDEAQNVLPSKVRGWEGIVNGDDNAMPYTLDNLNALLDVPYIERAFAIGLIQASNGAPAKNSKAGSDG